MKNKAPTIDKILLKDKGIAARFQLFLIKKIK